MLYQVVSEIKAKVREEFLNTLDSKYTELFTVVLLDPNNYVAIPSTATVAVFAVSGDDKTCLYQKNRIECSIEEFNDLIERVKEDFEGNYVVYPTFKGEGIALTEKI